MLSLITSNAKAENWVITKSWRNGGVAEIDIDSIKTSGPGITEYKARSRGSDHRGEYSVVEATGYAMCDQYTPQVLDMGQWVSLKEMVVNIQNGTGFYDFAMHGAPTACNYTN